MAITGEGTATEPFIVTTYEELKEKMEASYTQGSTTYIQLGNDIDGEDYELGTTFHISTQNRIQSIDLDLHGFAIKNWYIAGAQSVNSNQTLFTLYCSVYMHNGKIINIYGHYTADYKSYAFIYCQGVFSQSGTRRQTFENISFSWDMTKCAFGFYDVSAALYTATFTNCSFYMRSDAALGSGKFGFYSTGGSTFTSCDFYFDDLQLSGSTNTDEQTWSSLFFISSNNYTYRRFTYCRFQGKVTCVATTTTQAYYSCILEGNILDNCVINLTCATSVPDEFTGRFYIYLNNNNSGNRINLVNIDLLSDASVQIRGNGFVQAHTNQMDMRVNPNADVVLNDELHWDVQKG